MRALPTLYVLGLLGNRRIECVYLLLKNLEWKLMTVLKEAFIGVYDEIDREEELKK